VPQFIVLAASSPFSQGVDTAFATSRLHAVSAFPLSGHMPAVETWHAFEAYFERMASFGIVRSMKDFYWDVRPKPEYGTIEIRVCDTPLDIETAAAIAAFAQALCAWLGQDTATHDFADQYHVYDYNRFQACRFGYGAEVVDVQSRTLVPLREQLLQTLEAVLPQARSLGSEAAIALLRERARSQSNGARWMREAMQRYGSLADVVRDMCAYWAHAKDRLAA
jgi:carboxylate-amine ligase